MAKFPLDLSKFKKVKADEKSSTLRHPDGHEIKVAHKGINHKMLKDLHKMPMMAEGGDVKKEEEPGFFQGLANKANELGTGLMGLVSSAPNIADTPPAEASVMSTQVPTTATMAPAVSPEAQAAPPPQQFKPQQVQPIQKQPEKPAMEQIAQGKKEAGVSALGSVTKEEEAQAALGRHQAATQKAQASQAEKNIADAQEFESTYNSEYQKGMKSLDDAKQAFAETKLNPNHWQESLTTGAKVTNAIALFLGGISSGLAGGPNPALRFINDQIDRDVKAQEKEIGKKATLLEANYKQFGDWQQAKQMTRLQIKDIYAMKMQKMALESGSKESIDKANIEVAKIDKEKIGIIQNNAMNSAKMKMMTSNSQGKQDTDPASQVQFLVPPEHQKKVFDEIDAAKNTVKAAKGILKAFDDSYKNWHKQDFVPGALSSDQKAFHALMGPTFQDVEGTVRQAAMDNMYDNTTPSPWLDSEYDKKRKRDAVVEYIKSKEAASTAKGYGIDLANFPATHYDSAPEIQTKDGVKYQKVDGGWKKMK